MKTIAEHRSCMSSLASNRTARLVACFGAATLCLTTLPSCAKPVEGSNYHSDIDHNGQPFDEFFPSDSKDAKSGESECCHESKP